MSANILITGGAGYVGSHCLVELLNNGLNAIVIDNCYNSRLSSISRVEEITNKKVQFVQGDLCNKEDIRNVFNKYKIDAVVHCAAMKYVGESIQLPLPYYTNNLTSTLNLLQVMEEKEVFNLVFSSSASVYGNPKSLPLKETDRIGENITNVYGSTKYFIEKIFIDLSNADKRWNFISLRYFNPIGAHVSGKLGEDNTKKFSNLMPLISKVASGQMDELKVFGNNYDTRDGTPIRDYIHVMDLAEGHVSAVNMILSKHVRCKAYNLGIGKGLSVLEIIKEFEKASGKTVKYTFYPRREGDVPQLVCDTSLAKEELGWIPERNVQEMCEDFWRWQVMNPKGFQ